MGVILKYDFNKNKIFLANNFGNPTTSYIKGDAIDFTTTIGILEPSEIASGKMYQITRNEIEQVASNLHRPVHTTIHDLNVNGHDELLVCEFGHLTGALTLFYTTDDSPYQKKPLINQPGIIRSIIRDMNNDGKPDVLFLSSQGNEGVGILYQEDDLKFKFEQVLRFSPIYVVVGLMF